MRSLIHGGNDQLELSVWHLRTGVRTVGLKRGGAIVTSTLSPDRTTVCVAAKDGLAMYRLTAHGQSLTFKLLWEASSGTAFCDAAFSCDGKHVASIRGGSGVVEVRDVGSNSVVASIDDFPAAGWGTEFPYHLSYSSEWLAVGGSPQGAVHKQVRLYSLSSSPAYKEYKTLEDLPAKCFSVSFNHSGTRLAVSTHG